MPCKDIEFKTSDNVTVRGWLFTPTTSTDKLPCLVMSHGFSGVKEQGLDDFANYFVDKLQISCLAFDNRGFGASDTKDGEPRFEIVPALQCSDYSDAITFAQSLPEVDGGRIGVWGSSFSGGNAMWVGAADRRVKAVLCQVPLTDGWETLNRFVRGDLQAGLIATFAQDRVGRMEGKDPIYMPVVTNDPLQPAALPSPDSYEYFQQYMGKSSWENKVTVRSLELLRGYNPSAMIHRISPTPLLMTVAETDVLCPIDMSLEAYTRAREPKKVNILPGGHFDPYSGPTFESNVQTQVKFLEETLCKRNSAN